MADVTAALEAAIRARLVADTDFMALVTGVYNTRAPDNAAYPFIIFELVAVTPNNALGRRNYWEYLYQFRCIDKGLAKTTILQALARIDALLERATLTPEGATVLGVLREDSLPDLVEMEGGTVYQQVGANWRFWVQET